MKYKLNAKVFYMILKRFVLGETMQFTAGPNQNDYLTCSFKYADGYRLLRKGNKVQIIDVSDPSFCLNVVGGDNLWFDEDSK